VESLATVEVSKKFVTSVSVLRLLVLLVPDKMVVSKVTPDQYKTIKIFYFFLGFPKELG
jgi:hypothetical protein